MAHDSPAHEYESGKNLNPNLDLSPWPFSAADSATPDESDTSAHDFRSRSNVTLVKAGPPDSQVNNVPFTPFCHTSCQPGLPVAATPSTLPQLVKNANQLTARSEHL